MSLILCFIIKYHPNLPSSPPEIIIIIINMFKTGNTCPVLIIVQLTGDASINPYCTGGGGGAWEAPLDVFGDCAATPRNFEMSFHDFFPSTPRNFEMSFHDFFPSSLTHILIPFSSKSDIPVRCYITISMRMLSKKCYNCIYSCTSRNVKI